MTYLDHAATTDVRPEVIEAMTSVLATTGNASSLHAAGRNARKQVEVAREQVAQALDCLPSEVVFTSGGTEADNLAIKGLYWSRRAGDARRVRVLASAVEHHAVLDPVQWLVDFESAVVEWIPVDADGVIDVEWLRAAVEREPETVALISVMWANNEVGSVQPIESVVSIAAEFGIPVHSDAVQAVGQLPVSFRASKLDAMTVSGHKLGGPMGVGALILKREHKPVPVLHGGGQEREVRSGTLSTHLIVGFGRAVSLAVAEREAHAAHVSALRDRLIESVSEAVSGAVLRGSASRLPGNAHFTFDGCEGDALLMLLDAAGVQVSTGSACTAGIPQPSHVLLAMGVPVGDAVGALRFSLGRTSRSEDVDNLVMALPAAVDRARRAGKALKSR